MTIRRIMILIMALLLAIPAQAAESMIPEDLLHEAVMTLTWEENRTGECWAEGHIVIGESDKGDTHEVYAYVSYNDFGFRDGVFTDAGGGGTGPVTLVFDKTASGYSLREVIRLEDGEYYGKSVSKMFPDDCVKKLSEGVVDADEMKRQQFEQAQAYLDSIGRTEDVQDWRERDLQLSDMLVYASNQLTGLVPPYPLWLTTEERIEDGVRYVYRKDWMADETVADNGEGRPGVMLLTKTRYDDGALMEMITVRVTWTELTVTMEDVGGQRVYRMTYDGRTYHQPVITEKGECGMFYEAFDRYCSDLPE